MLHKEIEVLNIRLKKIDTTLVSLSTSKSTKGIAPTSVKEILEQVYFSTASNNFIFFEIFSYTFKMKGIHFSFKQFSLEDSCL